MPALEVYDLVENAVLWPMVGYDRFGQPAVGAPQQIKARWSRTHREVVDSKGNTIALDAEAAVGQVIPVGSHLWFGDLVDWYGTASASTDEEVYEVKSYASTADVKIRNRRMVVGLMRLHQQQGGN